MIADSLASALNVGKGPLRKAIVDGFVNVGKETVNDVITGVFGKRKPDGTVYTWGDLMEAVPQFADAVPKSLRKRGIADFLLESVKSYIDK